MHFSPVDAITPVVLLATYDTSRIPLSLPRGGSCSNLPPAASLMCPTGAHCDRSTKFLEGWLGCVACSPILSVLPHTHGRRKEKGRSFFGTGGFRCCCCCSRESNQGTNRLVVYVELSIHPAIELQLLQKQILRVPTVDQYS